MIRTITSPLNRIDYGVHEMLGKKNMTTRRITTAGLFCVSFFWVLPIGYASSKECGHQIGSTQAWDPPVDGIVQNAVTAMKIAHIAWSAVNPRAAKISEADWQGSMAATLKDNVWTVTQKQPKDAIGGGLLISISQCDARVIDISMTQ